MSDHQFQFQITLLRVTGLPSKLVDGGKIFISWKRGAKKGNQGETKQITVPKNSDKVDFNNEVISLNNVTMSQSKGNYEKKDLSFVLSLVNEKGKSGNIGKSVLFLNRFGKEGQANESVSFVVKGSKQVQLELQITTKKLGSVGKSQKKKGDDSESKSEASSVDDSLLSMADESKIEPVVSEARMSPGRTKVQCPHCDRSFRSQQALESHFEWDHPEAKSDLKTPAKDTKPEPVANKPEGTPTPLSKEDKKENRRSKLFGKNPSDKETPEKHEKPEKAEKRLSKIFGKKDLPHLAESESPSKKGDKNDKNDTPSKRMSRIWTTDPTKSEKDKKHKNTDNPYDATTPRDSGTPRGAEDTPTKKPKKPSTVAASPVENEPEKDTPKKHESRRSILKSNSTDNPFADASTRVEDTPSKKPKKWKKTRISRKSIC